MRMSAATLDLSRFPAPLALRVLDFETVVASRLARLKELFGSVGIDYDGGNLETDPAVILQQSDGYRELLVRAEVNDAVRAVMVAFAVGSDLEHLAAFYGVARRVIAPASGSSPAGMESDAELRRRALLAPEAFAAAGPAAAYAYHALSADPRVLNVDVWSPGPGKVTVAVQSREGDGIASDALVSAVRAHLYRDDIKPLTDHVLVRSIVNVPYQIQGTGYVLPGPDRLAVQAAAVTSIEEMARSRRTPARDVPRSAVFAAASVAGIDKVLLASPVADIARDYGEVAVLSDIDFEVLTHDG